MQNVPQTPLSMQEMDDVYAFSHMLEIIIPCMKDGGVPAIRKLNSSLISNRGCWRAAISAH